MNEIANIHRNETIGYVLNLVRGLHRTEADRAAFYARQPHAISLENIARDRSGRLEQLVHAIEAGLFDQLDTEAAEAADAPMEAFVDVADAERYALRDEYVNAAGPDPEVALNVRDQAIGCITEKLRELARIENALHANHARATKELGGMSYQTYSDHREAAELNYVTADYYELLIEAITAIPLFDQLDKQLPREESAIARDATPDLVSAMSRHSSTHGTAAVYDPADPHDAALAEQARAEQRVDAERTWLVDEFDAALAAGRAMDAAEALEALDAESGS